MQIRTPAVAGMFYPDNKTQLTDSINSCFLHKFGPGKTPPVTDRKKIFGVVCPHAGYMYSGPIACNSYYAISSNDTELFIIVGPNHWSIGCNVATVTDCQWETPFGNVLVDSETAQEISNNSEIIEIDFFSHTREHSLEVQIPMLQYVFKNFKILPISMINQSKDVARSVGISIANIMKKTNAMIIGSSDFTHYEPNDFAHKQDSALIEPILEMNVDKFYDILYEKNVTACGYGAIAATIVACKEMGAKKGELLKYATSGDVSGDKTSVVGYGSIIFT